MAVSGKKGFRFVKIMVIAGIAALLSAAVLLGIMKSKQSINEKNAIASLALIRSAMESFRAGQTPRLYTNAVNLNVLSTANPPYIGTALGSGTKQGYNFRLADVTAYAYTIQARPVMPRVTGGRSFVLDETGLLRARQQSDWLKKGQGEIIK
ncbi:MAG: hypothetical protein PHV77_01655 [Candidatus Omnitrophica bacterium]|nr:hypothetical protein [Candidatus Omnitrophota bacterium]